MPGRRQLPALIAATALASLFALGGVLLWGAGAAVGSPRKPAARSAPTAGGPPPALANMQLSVLHARGSPPFALLGAKIIIRGLVKPYAAGQQVKLSVYRDGRKIAVKQLGVVPGGAGAGQFHVVLSSARAGLVQVRATHYATAQQGLLTARASGVHFLSPNLGPGATGGSVGTLQSELNRLHYAVPLSGTFDAGTARAVIAYRKTAGLDRVAFTNTGFFKAIERGWGRFRVRYRGDGRHVEADLTRQVLAEIDTGGRVQAIYQMSSGKPSTPTVVGRFRVYEKTPGFNAKGMLDSNYFISGYAIHGYAEVPTFAASHGCLRIPIPDAGAVFAWVQIGTPVDVYNEGGGGSGRVRANAGP
jgi:L,D-transpeptidase-like protein/putative peptidoglycan binding protein